MTRPVPPTVLVLGAVVSVQFGGALAATLIPLVGVLGSVWLRLAIALVVLVLIRRPRVRGRRRSDWVTVVAFGVALATMNAAFYASLTRLPIGVAVTVEFLGPLLLAASQSRRRRDAVAVLAAGLGVVLIAQVTQFGVTDLDAVGLGLALLAGACWAAYILLSARTGARFAGLDGLTLAMTVGALLTAPFGVSDLLGHGIQAEGLLRAVGVALLSSVIPYSLELAALRRMRAQVFGILLSLEPAVAALAGRVVLGQLLTPAQLAGMSLVVLASALTAGGSPPPRRADPG